MLKFDKILNIYICNYSCYNLQISFILIGEVYYAKKQKMYNVISTYTITYWFF